MNVSQRGLEFIARFEGCVLHPYNDAASPPNATIGYGHMIHRGAVTPADVRKFKEFTLGDAMRLLVEDAQAAVHAVASLGVRLNQHEFDALVSFAFNCGGGALMGGIARSLKAGRKQQAMSVLREYVHAGSEVLPGLVRRRTAESALFLHGIYA